VLLHRQARATAISPGPGLHRFGCMDQASMTATAPGSIPANRGRRFGLGTDKSQTGHRHLRPSVNRQARATAISTGPGSGLVAWIRASVTTTAPRLIPADRGRRFGLGIAAKTRGTPHRQKPNRAPAPPAISAIAPACWIRGDFHKTTGTKKPA